MKHKRPNVEPIPGRANRIYRTTSKKSGEQMMHDLNRGSLYRKNLRRLTVPE
jgi:hypothetical protein